VDGLELCCTLAATSAMRSTEKLECEEYGHAVKRAI